MKNVSNFSKALKWEVETAVKSDSAAPVHSGSNSDVVSPVLLGMQFRDHTMPFDQLHSPGPVPHTTLS